MAITASGQIRVSNVPTEFGGAEPHRIGEYYRNGAYVGSSNTGVPTSGQIRMSDFYGATASITVTVTQGIAQYTEATALKYRGYILDDKGINNSNSNFYTTNGTKGSRSPTTLNGATIQGIYDKDDDPSALTTSFSIVLAGTRAKSFFTSVTPQGGSTLLTANAIHFQAGGSTGWVWDDGEAATIPGWDGSGSRTAIFT
jgi:hypothetical protein